MKSDTAKLISTIIRFREYVRMRDGHEHGIISFVDSNTFLGREENYKSTIFEKAHAALDYSSWKENWIGNNSEIRKHASLAMSLAGNLVNFNQQIHFQNVINPLRNEFNQSSEQALYDIYRSIGEEQEAAAFEQAKRCLADHMI